MPNSLRAAGVGQKKAGVLPLPLIFSWTRLPGQVNRGQAQAPFPFPFQALGQARLHAQVLAVLTPEQREELLQRLRTGRRVRLPLVIQVGERDDPDATLQGRYFARP